MLKTMHHYGLVCPDLEKSVAFYRDAMGFRLLGYASEEVDGEEIKLAYLQIDSLVLELSQPAWAEESMEWAAANNSHLCLGVGDISAIRKKLEYDFGVQWDSIEETPDAHVLFFRGPGNEYIELTEFITDLFPVSYEPHDDPYILGLGHIGIFTGDIEKSVAFYRDVLGCKVIKQFEEGGPDMNFWNNIAFLDLNGTIVEFVEPICHPVIQNNLKYSSMRDYMHVAYTVDDLSAVQAAFSKSADILDWERTEPVAISSDLGTSKWIAFRGPNGERIQLFA